MAGTALRASWELHCGYFGFLSRFSRTKSNPTLSDKKGWNIALRKLWSRAKFILSIFRANSGNKCRRSNWIKQSLPLFFNAPDIRYTSFSSSRIAKNLIKLLDNFQVMCVFTYIRLIKCVSLYPPHSAMATRARATSHVENQVRESFKFYTIFRLVLILGKRTRSETINFWRARRPWRPNEWLPQCARLWATLTSTPGFTL